MSLPESPHQAAIAGAFTAAKSPELPPRGQQLVAIYDGTFGASGPYCCPAALANVLEAIGARADAAALRGQAPPPAPPRVTGWLDGLDQQDEWEGTP